MSLSLILSLKDEKVERKENRVELDSIRIASGLDKRMVRRMGKEESRMLCRFVVINSANWWQHLLKWRIRSRGGKS